MHVLQNSKQECAMHQGKKALVYLSYSLKLLSDSLFIACDCLSKTINGILWFSMEWGCMACVCLSAAIVYADALILAEGARRLKISVAAT